MALLDCNERTAVREKRTAGRRASCSNLPQSSAGHGQGASPTRSAPPMPIAKGIIDRAKVVRLGLENAVSVAGLPARGGYPDGDRGEAGGAGGGSGPRLTPCAGPRSRETHGRAASRSEWPPKGRDRARAARSRAALQLDGSVAVPRARSRSEGRGVHRRLGQRLPARDAARADRAPLASARAIASAWRTSSPRSRAISPSSSQVTRRELRTLFSIGRASLLIGLGFLGGVHDR